MPPESHLADPGDIFALFTSYRYFVEHHQLPFPGTMKDQPPVFAWMVDFGAAVNGAYLERREAREAEDRRLEKLFKERFRDR